MSESCSPTPAASETSSARHAGAAQRTCAAAHTGRQPPHTITLCIVQQPFHEPRSGRVPRERCQRHAPHTAVGVRAHCDHVLLPRLALPHEQGLRPPPCLVVIEGGSQLGSAGGRRRHGQCCRYRQAAHGGNWARQRSHTQAPPPQWVGAVCQAPRGCTLVCCGAALPKARRVSKGGAGAQTPAPTRRTSLHCSGSKQALQQTPGQPRPTAHTRSRPPAAPWRTSSSCTPSSACATPALRACVPRQRLPRRHVGSHVFSLRFTEEGTVLAAGCDDGSVKVRPRGTASGV